VNGIESRRRLVWLGLGLALFLVGAGRADYPESFKEGIRSRDFHDWPKMVAAMRQAIAQQPQATGENVRIYGNYVAPYLPQYFLGLGLFRQGDWLEAAKAFREAQAQGTVRGLNRGRLEFFQEVCSRHLEATGQRAPSPPRPPRTSLPAANPVPPDPPNPVHKEPKEVLLKALDDAEREARKWLKQGDNLVRDLKTRGGVDPDLLAVAESRIRNASFLLDGCRREGDLDGVQRARDDAHAACEILDEMVKGR
jgi:hypothetical protein